MSIKSIGILTLQNSNNYGAMYQVFALSKYLRQKGHDVFVIDYEMTRDVAGLVDYIIHPLALLEKIFYKRELIYKKINFKKPNKLFKKRDEVYSIVFSEFRDQYLKILSKKYNYQSLLDDVPNADVYICGSDQVWAADFLFTSPAFLLGFVPEGRKRVAYAASFGKTKLESYLHKVFVEYLKKFDVVSVREKSGVELVKSMTGLDPDHVLDPTLLLSGADYTEIIDCSLVPKENYILLYKLDQDKSLSQWFDSCVNEISSLLGLSVVAVSTNSREPFDEGWCEKIPTPGQLLGLIERSSLTITNSFHGTVFSILLQSKFLAFPRDKYKEKQNVRIEELLSGFGLYDFYCPPFQTVDVVLEKLAKSYDQVGVNTKLIKMRETSVEFLDGAVG